MVEVASCFRILSEIRVYSRGQGVRRGQSIDGKHPVDVTEHDEVLNVGCKAFIQPQVIPPLQGHQITKPLKGQQREKGYSSTVVD
ncbi:hypothetical protein EYF80_057102 [Liparis tanakae]|uniref:Uncharacterized protein n=1 Tax=Liparis tanakae TaxID=230148 RepID=A0A4Z2EUW9_9TELE|nr:hypothetical protein EYF80_057102 [Liparis tanakae]